MLEHFSYNQHYRSILCGPAGYEAPFLLINISLVRWAWSYPSSPPQSSPLSPYLPICRVWRGPCLPARAATTDIGMSAHPVRASPPSPDRYSGGGGGRGWGLGMVDGWQQYYRTWDWNVCCMYRTHGPEPRPETLCLHLTIILLLPLLLH